MKKYEHLFFDLDHTLWDFEKNSEETINELFQLLRLENRMSSANHLYKSFSKANRWVWDQYHKDLIGKEAFRSMRFDMALEENGIKDTDLSTKLSDLYVKICPSKPHLLDGCKEVLAALSKKYMLHLISNGFEETTMQKIESTLIKNFFATVTTPTLSGYKKPHSLMFQYALNNAGCVCHHAVMIGDDLEADVIGARDFGMDTVYFNPERIVHTEKVNFEITKIPELLLIL